MIREELKRIAKRNRGLLKPAKVVDAARDPDSPLHNKFTWDDAEAASEHRLWQARALIGQYWVVEPTTRKDVRLFISLDSDRQSRVGYRTSEAVLDDPAKRQEWLLMALADFQQLERAYGTLQELQGIFQAIRRVAAKYEQQLDAA